MVLCNASCCSAFDDLKAVEIVVINIIIILYICTVDVVFEAFLVCNLYINLRSRDGTLFVRLLPSLHSVRFGQLEPLFFRGRGINDNLKRVFF